MVEINPLKMKKRKFIYLFGLTLFFILSVRAGENQRVRLVLPTEWVPNPSSYTMTELQNKAVLARFQELNPDIELITPQSLIIQGKEESSILMKIAADISPDILYVIFRNADTYIQQGFLYPMDDLIKNIPEEENKFRIPESIWPVIKRPGRDGKIHVWAYPQNIILRVMAFRKDIFKAAGLDINHPPQNWNELFECCKRIHETNLKGKPRYGMGFTLGSNESENVLALMNAAGAEAVQEYAPNQWRASFDSPGALEAFFFYYKLCRSGVVYRGNAKQNDVNERWEDGQLGFNIESLFSQHFTIKDPSIHGFFAFPGPNGPSAATLNCSMMGIYSGIKDPRVQEAAWRFIRFYNGPEAMKLRVQVLVDNNEAHMIHPKYLEATDNREYISEVPKDIVGTYDFTLPRAKPEPYGRNCNLVYKEMTKPLDQIFHDQAIEKAWVAGDEGAVKHRIRTIVTAAVQETNKRMLNQISNDEKRFRGRVAAVVVATIFGLFIFLFRYIWKLFTPKSASFGTRKGSWQFRRYWMAYLFILPAFLSVLIWQYIPLLRGSSMAFQNHMIMGDSEWVGLGNFAEVLFDPTFWNSLWVTCQYAFWSLTIGFLTPVVLAILLHEVPRGKVVFRLIYYLPAVISGLVVIFLWKTFYLPDGLLNQLLQFVGINSHINWIYEPKFVLIACVLPTVWASAGPGCLIYLAALKTIPDDLYEAGDIDGANFFHKIVHIIIPSLKGLLIINFIGAFVGTFHSSQFILAMTAGGPYTPYGATEVTSLLIFSNAFMYLRLGIATAMAWMLGALLIGFTIFQLKRLSKMEFKTTEGES